MAWPDIFFKARKPKPESELPPPFKPAPESAKSATAEPKPPAIQPVPVGLESPGATTTAPLKTEIDTTNTRTIPAMHGVVLRPPAKLATTVASLKMTPSVTTMPLQTPLKNIEQLMAEADPVQTLRQTGNLRVLKPLTDDPAFTAEPTAKTAELAPNKSETDATSTTPLHTKAVVSTTEPTSTQVLSDTVPLHPEPKKIDPAPVKQLLPATAATSSTTPPEENDSPFILKPAVTPDAPVTAPKVIPPSAPSKTAFSSIFRRKAKMADVARIVLPPKREDHETPPASTEPSPTVVPPAFPVAAMTARVHQSTQPIAEKENAPSSPPAPDKSEALEKIVVQAKTSVNKDEAKKEPTPTDNAPVITAKLETPISPEPQATQPTPVAETKLVAPSADLPTAPKVDPKAHQPEPSATPAPKVDPEAHKSDSQPSPPAPAKEISTPTVTPEKREFHLANGERVAGVVLSETPEAVYIEHGTLGVLTIPRANIAKRLVEIILINGDRIVGDIMAETADTLYVRHASLGMLTVPRAQRSTRVVEAILKDGDRILGEMLTESDAFTVIRSASLGTVTLPHNKVSMLNRKIEQVELKSLPPPAPEIKDKPKG